MESKGKAREAIARIRMFSNLSGQDVVAEDDDVGVGGDGVLAGGEDGDGVGVERGDPPAQRLLPREADRAGTDDGQWPLPAVGGGNGQRLDALAKAHVVRKKQATLENFHASKCVNVTSV